MRFRFGHWQAVRNAVGGAAFGGTGCALASKLGDGDLRPWPFLGRFFFLRAATASSSIAAEHPPPTTWDPNWDKRNPDSLVRAPAQGASEEQAAAYREKVKKATPTAKRTLVLVRHGQYEMSGQHDSERKLTVLGKEQARLTGARLAALRGSLEQSTAKDGNDNNTGNTLSTSVVMSTMTRATETAKIILEHFPGINYQSCDFIREGAPCEPVPNTVAGVWDPEPHLFFSEGARIEAGFRKYFHRADPSQKQDSLEIIVCHGNVIRYCICRALQLPPQAWLRFAVHNGSYTIVTIQPSGRVSVSAVGESGHLPVDKLTFN